MKQCRPIHTKVLQYFSFRFSTRLLKVDRHGDSGEEMERRRRARTWMEQKIMEEEWARMRAQQKQWKNHQSGRFDHVMPLMFLIMGSMVAFQMLFFSITPSGCSQFAEGCCCAKCLEHERCEEKSCFFCTEKCATYFVMSITQPLNGYSSLHAAMYLWLFSS